MIAQGVPNHLEVHLIIGFRLFTYPEYGLGRLHGSGATRYTRWQGITNHTNLRLNHKTPIHATSLTDGETYITRHTQTNM